jgi:hypothetical protein
LKKACLREGWRHFPSFRFGAMPSALCSDARCASSALLCSVACLARPNRPASVSGPLISTMQMAQSRRMRLNWKVRWQKRGGACSGARRNRPAVPFGKRRAMSNCEEGSQNPMKLFRSIFVRRGRVAVVALSHLQLLVCARLGPGPLQTVGQFLSRGILRDPAEEGHM